MKHPEGKRLDDAIAEAKAGRGKQSGIKKEVSVIKAGEGDGEFGSGIMTPDSQQLAKINQFTRTTKTEDDVVVFSTLSCNDLVDRDDDQFTTECVQDFASLKGDLSSVGKSYMVSHDYTKLPVGRIFDVGTQDVEGATFLKNEVYIPNTQQNKDFIENVDYGIYWAVSVGVMLGADECSVCASPMSAFFGMAFCDDNGHMKGNYYNPKSEETDDYGWAIPVEANAKGAKKCVRMFKEPRDFYELSQVFLGAQYFASLEKKPGFDGILKAAGAGGVPIIGLSKSEAEQLPIPHVPKKVAEAQAKYAVGATEEGTKRWADEEGLTWEYDPETDEVLCLGKSSNQDNQEETDGEPISGDSSSERTGDEDDELGVGVDSGSEVDSEDGDSGSAEGSEQVSERSAQGSSVSDPDGGDESLGDEVDPVEAPEETAVDEEDEEEDMSKEAVIRTAKAVHLPTSIVDKVAESDGPGLDLVLRFAAEEIDQLQKQVGELTPKSVLGDKYIKALRADALDWYVKAYQSSDTEKGVDTRNVEKLLDVCGENVELIKELAGQYQDTAQAKFPSAVRRSTFEDNVNDRNEIDGPADSKVDSKRVKRIHG